MTDSRRIASAVSLLLTSGVWVLLAVAACGSPTPNALGGRLVFERKVGDATDIYAMNADGGDLRQLTGDPGWDGEPSWSPDGSQIVFASDRAGGPAIWVMNADGSNPRALTEPSYASLTPAWSPDGQSIAFASTLPDEGDATTAAGDRFAIWVMNTDGSGARRVASDPTGQLLYPTWGPRSDRLAYVRQTSEGATLLIQMLDEDAVPQVLKLGTAGQPGAPAWSPNGSRIAFALDRQGLVEIWQAKPDGSSASVLGQAGQHGGDPAWSPDGRQIVFVSGQGGALSLMLVDVGGTNPHALVSDGARYAHPDWQ